MICSSRTPKINCMFFHPWLRSQHPSNLDVEDIEVLQKVMGTKIHQYEMSLESLLMNPWADTTASRRVKCRTESTWSADPCFKWWRTCCNIAMFMLTQRASTVFKRSKMSKKDISICIYIYSYQSILKKKNKYHQTIILKTTTSLPRVTCHTPFLQPIAGAPSPQCMWHQGPQWLGECGDETSLIP